VSEDAIAPAWLVTSSGWLKDATASYSDEEMRAALGIQNYASAFVTSKEIAKSIFGSRSETI
jgi:hypothetical protein